MEIQITENDRKLYRKQQPINNTDLVLHDTDRHKALSIPIVIPRIPTIYDLNFEGKLPEKYVGILGDLNLMYPKISFDNLTPLETVQVRDYYSTIKGMSRSDIWKIIKPFFSCVFTTTLGDYHSKMLEIARRSDNNPDYLPTYDWLVIISQKIINVREDLFKRNIDLNAKRYDTLTNPIETLLMLIKVQAEMFPKRSSGLTETFFSKFNLLILSHAELMLKLKSGSRTGEDFFGSKYNKIKDDLKTLKSISYMAYGGKPLSIKQQASVVNIIDDYKNTLDLIFAYNEDDKILFNTPFIRPAKDEALATLEVYHTFDDSATTRNGARCKIIFNSPTSCETINSIFIKDMGNIAQQNNYRNGISMINLTEYIKQYFRFSKSDRIIIQNKAMDVKYNYQKKLIELFFNVLERYLNK